jgi:hypothetical protein
MSIVNTALCLGSLVLLVWVFSVLLLLTNQSAQYLVVGMRWSVTIAGVMKFGNDTVTKG